MEIQTRPWRVGLLVTIIKHQKLYNTALNDLLRIILLSPFKAEFNLKRAIEHWHGDLDQSLGQSGSSEAEEPQTGETDDKLRLRSHKLVKLMIN